MGRLFAYTEAATVDKGSIQRIVQRYRSPYTSCGWAFVKALRIRPRPPLPHRENRRRDERRRDIDDCRCQRHGVEM